MLYRLVIPDIMGTSIDNSHPKLLKNDKRMHSVTNFIVSAMFANSNIATVVVLDVLLSLYTFEYN